MSNARLQQWTTGVLATLAALWVLACARQGQWAQAGWALLALVPHAPIMALETVWAATVAQREAARRPLGEPQALPQPYPPLWVWVRAWASEVGHAIRVFGWQQPWAHDAHPDHVPAQARGRRGVLLVHGFVCNRGFWNRWMPPLRQAGVPHVAVSLGPPFADIAQQAQGLQAAWQRLMDATGVPPLLVGHSMGGIVLRTWLAQQPLEVALQHEVVTIGSPHHGTALALAAQSEAAMQMRLLSDYLRDLASRESAERRARMTCYWSVCDNIVFPASTATLPGARNICVPGRPHVGLAQAPLILADVLQRTVPAEPERARS